MLNKPYFCISSERLKYILLASQSNQVPPDRPCCALIPSAHTYRLLVVKEHFSSYSHWSKRRHRAVTFGVHTKLSRNHILLNSVPLLPSCPCHTVVCQQQRNEIMKHLVFFVKAFLQQLENLFSRPLPKNPFKPLQLLSSQARYYESVRCKKQDLISLSTSRRFGLLVIISSLQNNPPKPFAAPCAYHFFTTPGLSKQTHNALI